MNLTPLFSSFFAEDTLSLDNEALEQYCRNIKSKDPGRAISNQGGWQSNLIQNVDEDLRGLYIAVMSRIDAINLKIGYSGPKVRMQSLWININGRDNYNEIHDHPSSFYAAVYYVKASEDQGKIKFHHPIPFFSNYSTMNRVEEYTMFNSVMWEMEPRTGTFLIFPSYLPHLVTRNMTDEERISIAFNFSLDWSVMPTPFGD